MPLTRQKRKLGTRSITISLEYPTYQAFWEYFSTCECKVISVAADTLIRERLAQIDNPKIAFELNRPNPLVSEPDSNVIAYYGSYKEPVVEEPRDDFDPDEHLAQSGLSPMACVTTKQN